ncbi:response regulator [Okeania sp.]|uniref:response regulator n=1 Tax=Okeania sp. TaxID=3100323 RepID=UPI002B4B1312|nr:response regulator [Okeania sp.]MEB3340132.1 response regulator [Okeania sp.]
MNKKNFQNLPDKNNILIVDDAPENLRLLSSMLEHQGYNVRKAINGKIAINGAQIAKPDLILLDINLPDIDGYEVCKKLKSLESTKEIPIIFLSAYSEEVDKVKAFEVGGRDYITKPFQLREVLARVENQLSIYQLQMQLKEKNSQLEKEVIERQNSEEQLNFLLSITAAINASLDIHSALEITLKYICENIKWDYGEAWLPNPDNSQLVYSQSYYLNIPPDTPSQELESPPTPLTQGGLESPPAPLSQGGLESPPAPLSQKLESPPTPLCKGGLESPPTPLCKGGEIYENKDLLGRVWHSKNTEWIEDISVTSPTIFESDNIAVKIGLKSAFAVPILWRNQVLAILVFFNRESLPKNQQLINLVKVVGNYLGAWIINN